jgi:FKBP-type peptidyl-prolyl cis-trans isomerase
MGRLYLAMVLAALPSAIYADDGDPQPAKAGTAAKGDAELKTEKHKGSYAIGYNVGQTLRKSIGAETLDLPAFLQGVQQSLSGEKASMSAIEQERAFKAFIATVQTQQMKKTAESRDANKKKGDDFLANNKKQKGIIVTPSGLQYLVLKEGNGKRPTKADKVEVHYHGTLLNGKVFDSSVDRGEPITFGVGQVIKGWQEALLLMKVGDKFRVFIPSELAYGARGTPNGGPIGPNEALIFEIELLKIK